MFDQFHHIVGQLHGGPSACNASQLWDFYGKFAMSWTMELHRLPGLKNGWIRQNIAGDTLNGFDPNLTTMVQTLDATDIMETSATLNGLSRPTERPLITISSGDLPRA